MNSIVPDYMTALVGYRAWTVTNDGDLLSLNQMQGEPWPNKVKKQALCTTVSALAHAWGASQLHVGPLAALTLATSSMYIPPSLLQGVASFGSWWAGKMAEQAEAVANHHAPEAGCSCGIYAAKSETSQYYIGYAEGMPVWGEVHLWGKVQKYTEGYRAEFAYPKALQTSRERLAERIAERYGVPCAYVQKDRVNLAKQQNIGLLTLSAAQNQSISAGMNNSNVSATAGALGLIGPQGLSMLSPPAWWRRYTGKE